MGVKVRMQVTCDECRKTVEHWASLDHLPDGWGTDNILPDGWERVVADHVLCPACSCPAPPGYNLLSHQQQILKDLYNAHFPIKVLGGPLGPLPPSSLDSIISMHSGCTGCSGGYNCDENGYPCLGDDDECDEESCKCKGKGKPGVWCRKCGDFMPDEHADGDDGKGTCFRCFTP